MGSDGARREGQPSQHVTATGALKASRPFRSAVRLRDNLRASQTSPRQKGQVIAQPTLRFSQAGPPGRVENLRQARRSFSRRARGRASHAASRSARRHNRRERKGQAEPTKARTSGGRSAAEANGAVLKEPMERGELTPAGAGALAERPSRARELETARRDQTGGGYNRPSRSAHGAVSAQSARRADAGRRAVRRIRHSAAGAGQGRARQARCETESSAAARAALQRARKTYSTRPSRANRRVVFRAT